MIYIITGPINSGKTTFLKQLYNLNKGDGFCLEKVIINDIYIGQKIVHLKTGTSTFFSLKLAYLKDDWDEVARIKDYSFSKQGIEFGELIINNIIKSKLDNIFIDEIGPLELANQGFYHLFIQCLLTSKNIYVVIRKVCLEEVISKFKLDDYIILAHLK